MSTQSGLSAPPFPFNIGFKGSTKSAQKSGITRSTSPPIAALTSPSLAAQTSTSKLLSQSKSPRYTLNPTSTSTSCIKKLHESLLQEDQTIPRGSYALFGMGEDGMMPTGMWELTTGAIMVGKGAIVGAGGSRGEWGYLGSLEGYEVLQKRVQDLWGDFLPDGVLTDCMNVNHLGPTSARYLFCRLHAHGYGPKLNGFIQTTQKLQMMLEATPFTKQKAQGLKRTMLAKVRLLFPPPAYEASEYEDWRSNSVVLSSGATEFLIDYEKEVLSELELWDRTQVLDTALDFERFFTDYMRKIAEKNMEQQVEEVIVRTRGSTVSRLLAGDQFEAASISLDNGRLSADPGSLMGSFVRGEVNLLPEESDLNALGFSSAWTPTLPAKHWKEYNQLQKYKIQNLIPGTIIEANGDGDVRHGGSQDAGRGAEALEEGEVEEGEFMEDGPEEGELEEGEWEGDA